MLNLLSGIAVIIDDTIHEPGSRDQIHKIVAQIEEKNIPIAKYDILPEDDALNHFSGISFVILDWNLKSRDLPGGIQQSDDQVVGDVIDFIRKLKSKVFGPIFIFTATSTREVKIKLKEASILDKTIIVAKKSGLLGGQLFIKLEKWMKSSPPVYVFKEWEREYNQAKNSLFIDFFGISHSWPKVLWENFQEDGGDTSFELGDVITRNIYTRMSPFNFDKDFVCSSKAKSNRAEIQSVLQGERYFNNVGIDAPPMTGDVFKETYNDNDENELVRYYINIRAQCDIMRRSNPYLYLLKGKAMAKEDIKEAFRKSIGNFSEKVVEAIVPFIDDGKVVKFYFREIHKDKWKKKKDMRIGRLLNPHVTAIQQRYSLYQQRQGLPRIPGKALPVVD